MANDIAQEQQGTLGTAEAAQAEAPIASFDATLTIGGRSAQLTFDVYGTWSRGFPGAREMPAEPKYLDVRRVLCNERDVSDWLNDDAFAELFWDAVYRR